MKIVSRARNPRAATEAERRDHEDQGHVQFRDWCVICHAARGTGQQHRHEAIGEDEELKIPKISADYGYMADKQDEEAETLPLLAVREKKLKAYAGTFVDNKGPTEYVVKYLVGWIRSLGVSRAIFQTDGEPALVALRN